MSSERELWIVRTTCPDRETALSLGRDLVAAGLAACAQVEAGIESCYVWQGRLQQDPEVPLTLKVCRRRLRECLDRLRASHPYEVPQLVAWPCVEVDRDYLAWACGEEDR